MIPADFQEANVTFGPPAGLDESQCRSIPGYMGPIQGGSCDGLDQVVVAYRLTEDEIARLAQGGLLFLTMIGGSLPPHYPSLSFEEATRPA